MVKIPEIVAYFIKRSETNEKAIIALILGSEQDGYIYDAVSVSNQGKTIGITDDGIQDIVRWAQHATEEELLGLIHGWEAD